MNRKTSGLRVSWKLEFPISPPMHCSPGFQAWILKLGSFDRPCIKLTKLYICMRFSRYRRVTSHVPMASRLQGSRPGLQNPKTWLLSTWQFAHLVENNTAATHLACVDLPGSRVPGLFCKTLKLWLLVACRNWQFVNLVKIIPSYADMYVCMYVCMYVRTYVCMYVCILYHTILCTYIL